MQVMQHHLSTILAKAGANTVSERPGVPTERNLLKRSARLVKGFVVEKCQIRWMSHTLCIAISGKIKVHLVTMPRDSDWIH